MIVPDPDTPGGERAKVLDFGIAKLLEDALGSAPAAQQGTNVELIMGTPRYMSPEQCRNAGGVEAQSDVYSLGVVLYQVLSGRTPFNQGARFELMIAHVQQEPPPLGEIAPQVPQDLAGLIHRMLWKGKEQRPSMAQVVSALDVMGAQPDDSHSLISRISQSGVEVSGQFSVLGIEGSGRYPVPGYEHSGGFAVPAFGADPISAPSRISQNGALLPSRISQSGNVQAASRVSQSGGSPHVRQPISGNLPVRRISPSDGHAPVPPPQPNAPTPDSATAIFDSNPSTLGSSAAQHLPQSGAASAPATAWRFLPWFIVSALLLGSVGLYGALRLGNHRPVLVPPVADAVPNPVPAPPKPAPPEPVRVVHWTLVTTPPGAQVLRARDGMLLGTTPWESDQPAGTSWEKLILELDGYAPREIYLDMSAGGNQHISLKPSKGKKSSRHQ